MVARSRIARTDIEIAALAFGGNVFGWTADRDASFAVLDAFTDSDMGLGGTNLKGFVLGGSYGIYRDTAVGLRWYSARNIQSMTYDPTAVTGQRYEVDTVMMDMNVRF